MSEKNDNWFGSWLNAAKHKSTEVLEFVKKDLEEFGTAVKNEASNVVSSAGSAVEKTFSLDSPDSTASNMKKSFSTFLGQVNTVLNPSPDDSDTEAILIVENSETVKLNKLQQAIYELQKNPETYLCDPEPSLHKQFQCWLEIIDDQLSDDRIGKHVNSSEILKRQYAKLVPDIVEHQIFWKRYLFKKALLEDEIARQEALEKRGQKEKDLEKDPGEDNLKWEQEEFAPDIELTEEEQIKLLEQYEHETKQKNKKSPKSRKQADKKVASSSPDKETAADESKTEQKSIAKKGSDKALDKVGDAAVSLDSPSSNSSIDDDWEKISDVEK